ncbi:monocarboxylate transporter 9 isoform X2 [Agrilus planipennis]|uniref:Monocarboxylate transporter 9 isoform X2 n=1 Tax=Agrilus planipennis TaxID=224129 RepID=A0A7F5R0X9_AGRPL|nr:monocarboxylate transporter 9 isoform X2 [Agrilus planipennis]
MASPHECKAIKYNSMVPDGGWGYLVVFSSTLFVILSLGPAVSIASIFGPFLSNHHDELSATTTLTSTYGAVFHLTGLITNVLLQKVSFRTVAFIGALLNSSGNFAAIFVTDLQFLILSYGVFQAIGNGLLIPSAFTALNEYFDSRKTFAIAICHTIVGATLMIYPAIAQLLMDNYGFRGTQAIVAAFSFNSFFAAFVLHPVKWHMKKIPTSNETPNFSELSLHKKKHHRSNKEFSETASNEFESRELLNENLTEILSVEKKSLSKSLTSIASFGNAVIYVELRKRTQKSSLWNSVDFSVLKDLNYWIIIFALSISLTSEMTVMSLLPVFLLNKGFNNSDVTLMMTTFFATDLIVKIGISLITAFYKIKTAEIYLANAILTVIFRIEIFQHLQKSIRFGSR